MVKVKVGIKEAGKAHIQTNTLNPLGFNAGTAIQALVDQHPGVILVSSNGKDVFAKGKMPHGPMGLNETRKQS